MSGAVAKRDRELVFERDDFRCVECGATEDLTIDHWLPRAHGGSNAVENLKTMCFPCNNQKGATIPDGLESRAKRKRKKKKAKRQRLGWPENLHLAMPEPLRHTSFCTPGMCMYECPVWLAHGAAGLRQH